VRLRLSLENLSRPKNRSKALRPFPPTRKWIILRTDLQNQAMPKWIEEGHDKAFNSFTYQGSSGRSGDQESSTIHLKISTAHCDLDAELVGLLRSDTSVGLGRSKQDWAAVKRNVLDPLLLRTEHREDVSVDGRLPSVVTRSSILCNQHSCFGDGRRLRHLSSVATENRVGRMYFSDPCCSVLETFLPCMLLRTSLEAVRLDRRMACNPIGREEKLVEGLLVSIEGDRLRRSFPHIQCDRQRFASSWSVTLIIVVSRTWQ